MQIRPGVTLLQAIAKASEARPVPFSERLADLQNGAAAGRAADAAPQPGKAAAQDVKPPAAPSPRLDASAGANGDRPAKPRGSLLNIVV
jgi:hypothetical protein